MRRYLTKVITGSGPKQLTVTQNFIHINLLFHDSIAIKHVITIVEKS